MTKYTRVGNVVTATVTIQDSPELRKRMAEWLASLTEEERERYGFKALPPPPSTTELPPTPRTGTHSDKKGQEQ